MTTLPAKGTLLACEFSGGSYTTIAQRTSISGPSRSCPEIETVHLDSTAHESIAGIPDNGEVTCEFLFDPDNSSHSQLSTLFTGGTIKSWKITFTDATPTTYTFQAYITGLEVNPGDSQSVVTATLTLRITGAITEA